MNTDLKWFKSSYSGSQGGECLEIAIAQTAPATPTTIHIRDSKHSPQGPRFTVTATTWTSFVTYASGS